MDDVKNARHDLCVRICAGDSANKSGVSTEHVSFAAAQQFDCIGRKVGTERQAYELSRFQRPRQEAIRRAILNRTDLGSRTVDLVRALEITSGRRQVQKIN